MALRDVLNQNADTEWFTQGRFGLFIHWGVYSVAARHEWVMFRERIPHDKYKRYADYFTADKFDPHLWAEMAVEAGMTYAVITTKHHDGFCLWDTDLTDFKAPNSAAGRDLLKEWTEAFRAAGLRIGYYHSLIDWRHPEYPIDGLHPMQDVEEFRASNATRDMAKYRAFLHGQVEEILTRYGKVDYLWFDYSYGSRDWGWSKGKGREEWGSDELVELIHKHQPQILLNNRLAIPDGGVQTPEQFVPRAGDTMQDFLTEECHTMHGSWGYDRDNLNWKSSRTLVRMLIDSVSRGGNLLLNVGPDARGQLDPLSLERMMDIGEWMDLHGDAIHGCGVAEFDAGPGYKLTQKDNKLFVHILDWPFGRLYIEGLGGKVSFARFLHDGSEVIISESKKRGPTDGDSHMDGEISGDPLTLNLPPQAPDVLVPVIELTLA